MKKYTFIDLAKEVLSNSEQPLSANDVWKKAVELNLVGKLSSQGKTPDKTLGSILYSNAKDGDENSSFISLSSRPVLYALRGYDERNFVLHQEQSENKESFHETDLHKILCSYVKSDPHFMCSTKTIRHEKSSNRVRGQNSWLHPDIVGVRYPFEDYSEGTVKLMDSMSKKTCKLFSFEMKRELGFSNLREVYFQAVSNSSWANEGYLVARSYDPDPQFEDEMRRLNSAFGIGFIRLDTEDYLQSEILLSAKDNENLDWNTIDRLSKANKDFKDFAESIVMNMKNGLLVVDKLYDETFKTEEEFSEYIKDKKINIF
ncbi:MAG: HTH domain-containing protein [Oscillospiraceae bacterium]|nr:HTH domain-containing protein [Oscillospiraceae bacterium]